jgi:hypothetical protein
MIKEEKEIFILIIGGYNKENKNKRKIYKYEIINNKWEKIKIKENEYKLTWKHASVYDNKNKIGFLYGGERIKKKENKKIYFNTGNFYKINYENQEVLIKKIKIENFEKIKSKNLLKSKKIKNKKRKERNSHSMVINDEKEIYIFGGINKFKRRNDLIKISYSNPSNLKFDIVNQYGIITLLIKKEKNQKKEIHIIQYPFQI